MVRRSWLLLLVLLAGCTGLVLDPGSPPGGPEGPSTFDPHDDTAGHDPDAAGPMPLRRLTAVEHAHVVRDLLGVSEIDGRGIDTYLGADPLPEQGFSTPGDVSDVSAARIRDVAEHLARQVDVVALAGCTSEDEACARVFVRDFGRRAYRRPLDADELDAHAALYRTLRETAALDHTSALRDLLGAMLQSPDFLYRWEDGPAREGPFAALGAHGLASRLSFFLWRSMPDETLDAAADSGALLDPAELERQARRMLDDPRARDAMAIFHREWLRLGTLDGAPRDPELYPEASAALFRSMQGEITTLASVLVLEEDATLEELLTTTRGYVNDDLAAIYGVDAPGSEALVAVELDPAQRRGLLTRAALLSVGANAIEGDPTKRGVMVRQRLLCADTGSPLPGAAPLPPPSAGLTVRQRHEQHFLADTTAPCITCHRRTDPIGFGLGHFDAIGRWQQREHDLPIDPSGVVVELDGADREFADHDALVGLLAQSDDVRECIERQWLRFALGRVEVRADDASLASTWNAFETSGFRIRELMVAIVRSRSFRWRAVSAGEEGASL